MTLLSDDIPAMIEALGQSVTAWGKTINALVDMEYTEVPGLDTAIGRSRLVLTVDSSDVPVTRAIGDLITINSVAHKCVDFRAEDTYCTKIVLADV